eukprot:gene12272-12409_t
MLVAPGAGWTQKSVRGNTPLVVLGLLYGLVLIASWSTDTLHLMMPGSLEEGLKGLSAAAGKDLRPAAKPILEKSGQGTITIMPYD